MSKVSLRQQMLLKRRNLSSEAYHSQSQQAQENLSSQACFRSAQNVAMYSPVRGEADTTKLFTLAVNSGKTVFFPKVVGSDLQFFVTKSCCDLKSGAFRVLEPIGSLSAVSTDFDLMVIPGVAFDLEGNRLGYGKGFYDRWLATNRPKVTVGLAFDLQIVNSLPAETHDQQLDFIVTETRFIPCHNGVSGSI